ncbi:hypothetical protein OF83DRAFT_1084921 [Amylostereum chailletii]|nr:hypothetical protein OF83DRAFT_1084921 [Amylostereum chailletii]
MAIVIALLMCLRPMLHPPCRPPNLKFSQKSLLLGQRMAHVRGMSDVDYYNMSEEEYEQCLISYDEKEDVVEYLRSKISPTTSMATVAEIARICGFKTLQSKHPFLLPLRYAGIVRLYSNHHTQLVENDEKRLLSMIREELGLELHNAEAKWYFHPKEA